MHLKISNIVVLVAIIAGSCSTSAKSEPVTNGSDTVGGSLAYSAKGTIYICPGKVTLRSGTKQHFEVFMVDHDRRHIPVQGTVTWYADPSSGSISQDGTFISGKRTGWYPNAVKVQAAGLSAQAIVEVSSEKYGESFVLERRWGNDAPDDLEELKSMAVSQDGTLYVIAGTSARVGKYDDNGNYLTSWGSIGTHKGQLNEPRNIRIDNKNIIYIQDEHDKKCRIQKFSASGEFISEFAPNMKLDRLIGVDRQNRIYAYKGDRIVVLDDTGKKIRSWDIPQGTEKGQIKYLYGVAVDPDGNIYFADAATDDVEARIQKFSASGKFLLMWPEIRSHSSDESEGPCIAIDKNGDIYVANPDDPSVRKYSPSGKLLRRIVCSGSIAYPKDIVVAENGNIFVCSYGLLGVITDDGTSFKRLLGYLFDRGRFISPGWVAIGKKGEIYVLHSQYLVEKYDAYGKYITSWKVPDGRRGTPELISMCIDSQDYIYLTDFENKRTLKYTPTGELVTEWPSEAWYIAGSPEGGVVAVGENGIYKLDPSGKVLFSFGTSDRDWCNSDSIAVDRAGNIYLNSEERIGKFSREGKLIARWSIKQNAYQCYPTIRNMVVGPDNNLYVSTDESAIQRFNLSGKFLEQFEWERNGNGGDISMDSNGNLYIADIYGGSVIKLAKNGRK